MILCLDIGNTRTKAALFEGRQLVSYADDLSGIKNLLKERATVIHAAIISSVAKDPDLLELPAIKKLSVYAFPGQFKLPFSNLYYTPQTLGRDRLAAVAGAHAAFPGQDVLVVNAGTCITFDMLEGKGDYLGGSISPGIKMRFKALYHYTSALPELEPVSELLPALVGRDTQGSILSGVLNGTVAEVQGIINQYTERYEHLRVVLAGGDSSFLAQNLKNPIFARPHLVLEGLNYTWLYNEE